MLIGTGPKTVRKRRNWMNKSLLDVHQEAAVKCYKLQKVRTSWRAIEKNNETNKEILVLSHTWSDCHNKANQDIDNFSKFVCEMMFASNDDETEDKEQDKDTNLIDTYSYSIKYISLSNQTAPSPGKLVLLFQHNSVRMDICNENEKEYISLGVGELRIDCDTRGDISRILFVKDGMFLLIQFMSNQLEQCVLNEAENVVDWIGNNHANKCGSTELIKCRLLFEENESNKYKLAREFVKSYNQCWNNRNTSIKGIKYEHDSDEIEVDVRNDKKSTKSKVEDELLVLRGMSAAEQTSKLYIMLQYELLILALHNKCHYNLYESDVIPRVVPSNVIAHQINNEKALLKLYKRAECVGLTNDFILHKNCEGMMNDTCCMIHELLPKYYESNKSGIKIFCELLDYFMYKKYEKRYIENIGCFVHLTCYAKRINFCSDCCLVYITKSNGLSKLFVLIKELIQNLKMNNHQKVISRIYALIVIIKILSNFLLYPLIMKYVFSFSTFYRKLFQFWVCLIRYIWNFKKTKHDAKNMKFDEDLIEMIIINIKAFEYGPIDENEIQLFAINGNNYLLIGFLFDLISHILTDFIHLSSKYWKSVHFNYLLINMKIRSFLMNWFLNEFLINRNKFSYRHLNNNYTIKYLKQYLNGKFIDKHQSRFEWQLFIAFKSIEYDAEYILAIWCILNDDDNNKDFAFKVGKNMYNNKNWKIFWKGLELHHSYYLNINYKKTAPFLKQFKQCNHCGVSKNNTNKLYICNRCKLVYYCSRSCQKMDWNKSQHHWLCNQLRMFTDNTRRLAIK